MKQKYNFLLALILLFGSSACQGPSKKSERTPQAELKQGLFFLDNVTSPEGISFRLALQLEQDPQIFKGCVLYLEGFTDSVRNHGPLFYQLSSAGYRVISYDYMGQGGSAGLMADTRISSILHPKSEIGHQARWVWDYFSTHDDPVRGKSCQGSKKFVIGWSTGGLAAYKLAYEKWADAVVLIAPGIHPKMFVGASAAQKTKLITSKNIVTLDSLTRNKFSENYNPHLDPIKPTSPLDALAFVKNLVLTSLKAQTWKISSDIPGLVFLSGEEDTYVQRKETEETLKKKATHFQVIGYSGALHELDNELPEVAQDLFKKTIQFFDQH